MRHTQAGFSLTRLVVGLAVIAVGLLLSLDRMGLLEADYLYRYWPVLLIVIGLTKLFSRRPSDLVFAIIFIGLGAWLLLLSLGYVDAAPWQYFWPIVLVLIGAFLVAGALRTRRAPAASQDYLRGFALIGSYERRSTSADFRGADLTAVMGACEVDLRQAKIARDTPEIDVFAFWGGIEVRVPQDWKIEAAVWPILGGFADETEQTAGPDAPTLRVKGAAIMGGIELKN